MTTKAHVRVGWRKLQTLKVVSVGSRGEKAAAYEEILEEAREHVRGVEEDQGRDEVEPIGREQRNHDIPAERLESVIARQHDRRMRT